MTNLAALVATMGALVAPWIGSALLQGTLLALITWALVRWPLRRMHSAVHGALWLLVLIKFLVPVGPAMPASLSSLTTASLQPWLPAGSISAEQTAAAPAASAPYELAMVFLDRPAAAPAVNASSPTAHTRRDWLGALAAAYVAACGVVAGLRLRAYWRFLTESERQPLAPASVARAVEAICHRVGVRRVPLTRLSPGAPAPYIYGIWRTVLVLSPRQLSSPEELEAAVLHEIAHIRRADLLVRHVQWLTGTLLFFWPVVAWVNRRIDWSRECACDEWALRHGRFSASQYARCLLRAAQPFKPGWIGYSPAAMAAYPSMVERRIEVILNTSNAKSQNWMRPAAAALLVCWAGFVLTGASAKDKPTEQSPDETKVVEAVGVWQAAPASECTFMVAGEQGVAGDVLFHVTPVQGVPFVSHWLGAAPFDMMPAQLRIDCEEGAEGPTVALAMVGGPTIGDFAQEHPGADADADGQVSPAEHDAYLIARAMIDPAAVLAQFPHGDRDGDGRLTAEEVARLVGGMMMRSPGLQTHMIKGEGGAIALPGKRVIVRQIGDAPPEVTVDGEKIDAEEAEQRGEIRVRRMAVAGEAGQEIRTGVALTSKDLALHMPPAVWIMENIDGEPTAADVARYVPLAGETPLRVFQERHPEADTDGDGKVTVAERDAFMEAKMAQVRQEILAKHPSADLDGDGVLSVDEMKQFHLSQIPADMRAKVKGTADEGGNVIVIKRERPEDR